MSREETLRISRAVVNGTVPFSDIEKVLTEYCLEFGKDPDLTAKFVVLLINTLTFSSPFSEALEYYEKLHHIIKLKRCPEYSGQEQIIYVN